MVPEKLVDTKRMERFIADAHCHLHLNRTWKQSLATLEKCSGKVQGVSSCGLCVRDWRWISAIQRSDQPFVETLAFFGAHPWYISEDGEVPEKHRHPDEVCASFEALVDQLSDSDKQLIHPTSDLGFDAEVLEKYLIAHPAAGIGEIGLCRMSLAPSEIQEEVFAAQVALARKHHRVMSVHCVGRYDRLLAIISKDGPLTAPAVLHSYSAEKKMAQKFVSIGCYFSFGSGIIDRSKRALKALSSVPLSRVLVETDSPCLLAQGLEPMPCVNGGGSHPLHVTNALEAVAEHMERPLEDIESVISSNSYQVFKTIWSEETPSWNQDLGELASTPEETQQNKLRQEKANKKQTRTKNSN